jgi:hypothetical protein
MQAIFSIKTPYANAIYAGTKQLELRRYAPRTRCTRIWLYETAPTKAITGYFTPATIFRRMSCEELLNAFGFNALTGTAYNENELTKNFQLVSLEVVLGNLNSYRAIRITEPTKLQKPIDPKTIFTRWQSPMSWRYCKKSEEKLLNMVLLHE